MRSLVIVALTACLCAVAMADGYGYSSYGSGGYGGGYGGGYESYGGGYNAYYGGAGYGGGYGSGYGHGYGKKSGRSRTVVMPYPVPVQAPVQAAGAAFPPAAGLGVNELIGLENESSSNGLFGSDGTGLLFLLFLIPLLFSSNTSG